MQKLFPLVATVNWEAETGLQLRKEERKKCGKCRQSSLVANLTKAKKCMLPDGELLILTCQTYASSLQKSMWELEWVGLMIRALLCMSCGKKWRATHRWNRGVIFAKSGLSLQQQRSRTFVNLRWLFSPLFFSGT